MPNYRAIARREAQRYGLDPNIFERQIGAESGWNPNARSPAGATGIAQIMPGTARAWGVNPNDPVASLRAAAKNMAKYVQQYGSYENALRAYNAGPGAIQKSKGYAETNNYVAKILFNGRDPGKLGPRGGNGSRPAVSSPSGENSTTTAEPLTGGPSNGAVLAAQILARAPEPQQPRPSMGLATPAFAAGPRLPTGAAPVLSGAGQAPSPGAALSRALSSIATLGGQEAAPEPSDPGGGAPAAPAGISANGKPSGGAQRALGWAISKLGSRETAGENRGGLASYANARFGMEAQPWCAMFTSLAVTKGGAPLSARTASVAQVREKAAAGQGYQRGYIPRDKAKPGDLILFGNRHIAMVESVERDGTLRYVGGNQSDSVTRGKARNGDIVRPLYGRRK